MQIRRAVATDENAIRELAQAFEVFGPYVEVFHRMLHGEDLTNHNVRFPVEIYVQEGDDGGVLGFIAVEWVEPGDTKTCEIHGISVRSGARRGGVASTLLDYVVGHGIKRGAHRLRAITAEVDNPPALRFLEARGFANQGFAGFYPRGQRAVRVILNLANP